MILIVAISYLVLIYAFGLLAYISYRSEGNAPDERMAITALVWAVFWPVMVMIWSWEGVYSWLTRNK